MGCAAGCRIDRTQSGFLQALTSRQIPVRLVLDTNVVLDLLHFSDPAVSPILHAIANHMAHCYASSATLDELRRVLTYSEFQLDATAQTTLLMRYQAWVSVAEPVSGSARKMPRCSDPDDQMFLELAASIQADFLISKDKAVLALKRHTGLGFKILTPSEAGTLWV